MITVTNYIFVFSALEISQRTVVFTDTRYYDRERNCEMKCLKMLDEVVGDHRIAELLYAAVDNITAAQILPRSHFASPSLSLTAFKNNTTFKGAELRKPRSLCGAYVGSAFSPKLNRHDFNRRDVQPAANRKLSVRIIQS